MKTLIITIKGMHCKSCEMLLKDEFDDINVKSQIDHKKGTAIVTFDETKTTLDQIKKVIADEDYEVISVKEK